MIASPHACPHFVPHLINKLYAFATVQSAYTLSVLNCIVSPEQSVMTTPLTTV